MLTFILIYLSTDFLHIKIIYKQSMALLKLEDISEARIYIFIHFYISKTIFKKAYKYRQPRAIERP